MAIAIDGSASSTTAVSNSVTLTLTTTLTNNVLVLFTVVAGSVTVSSITGTNGLTWTKRMASYSGGNGSYFMEEWYAVAPAALTGATIIINYSGAFTSPFAVVSAWNGVDTTTPYDVNVSLPGQAGTSSNSFGLFPTVNTTAANTVIIGMGRGSAGSPTSSLANNIATIATGRVDYTIKSAAFTGTGGYGWSGFNSGVAAFDALQQAGGAPVAYNDPLWFGMNY